MSGREREELQELIAGTNWVHCRFVYCFLCSRKSIDARMDDNSGSSGSPGGGHFAAPADKAAQRRADMRREEQERRRRVAVSGDEAG